VLQDQVVELVGLLVVVEVEQIVLDREDLVVDLQDLMLEVGMEDIPHLGQKDL